MRKHLFDNIIQKIKSNGIRDSYSKELVRNLQITNLFSIVFLPLTMAFFIIYKDSFIASFLVASVIVVDIINLLLIRVGYHKTGRFIFSITIPTIAYLMSTTVFYDVNTNGGATKFFILGASTFAFLVFTFNEWKHLLLTILLNLIYLLTVSPVHDFLDMTDKSMNVNTNQLSVASLIIPFVMFSSLMIYNKYLLRSSDNKLKFNAEEMEHLNSDISGKNQELKKINETLSRVITLKNRFLGIIAHDLRSPIGNIKQWSTLLLNEDGSNLSDSQQMSIEVIHSQSSKMIYLLNDLLDYTSYEEGNLKLRYDRYSLTDLLREQIKAISINANIKEIEIVTKIDKLEYFQFDNNRIAQVVNNLLSNSIKYSKRNTKIHISLKEEDGNAVVHFIDNGRGIANEHLDRIFEMYQTANVNTTAGEKSTGLGLSISKTIINAHKGKLTVSSKIGVGSDFSFSIPLIVEWEGNW